MEDGRIIELYWQRNETAIEESGRKYGAYCSAIARNILHTQEDTEECVSDTWLRAWNAIPPERPSRLAVFFGKITRNLAIDRFRKNKTRQFGGQYPVCLDELGECVGEAVPIEDGLALRELINSFLRELPERTREIFLLRYWYFLSVEEIADQLGASEGAVKMTLLRARNKLKDLLEQEGMGI